MRSRIAHQIWTRAWVALAASYGSGLSVEFASNREQAIAPSGQRILDRVDLDRGRVLPSASWDTSTGIIV